MKKRISIFIVFYIVLCSVLFPLNVKAEVSPSYINTRDTFWKLVQDVGYIGSLPVKGLQVMVQEFLTKIGNSNEASQITDEQKALEWINNGVVVNGDNVQIIGNQWNFVKSCIQDEIDLNHYEIVYGSDCQWTDTQGHPNLTEAWQNISSGYLSIKFGTSLACYDLSTTYLVHYSDNTTTSYYCMLKQKENDSYVSAKSFRSMDQDKNISYTPLTFSGTNLVSRTVSGNVKTYGYPAQVPTTNWLIDYGWRGYYMYYTNDLPDNPQIPNYFITKNYYNNIQGDTYNTTKTEIIFGISANIVVIVSVIPCTTSAIS